MAKWKEPDFKTRLAQQALSKNRKNKRSKYVVTLPNPATDDTSGWTWQHIAWVDSLSFIRSDEIKWLTKEEAIVYKLQGYNVTSAEKYHEKN